MEIAIILIFITAMVAMLWSVNVSKRLSVVVFGVMFVGIAITLIVVQGFTELAFKNIGFAAIALFVGWVRLSKSITDREKARVFLKTGSSRTNSELFCERCKTKSPDTRTPRNFSQLMWGGWTCPNCGAELDKKGKEKSNV